MDKAVDNTHSEQQSAERRGRQCTTNEYLPLPTSLDTALCRQRRSVLVMYRCGDMPVAVVKVSFLLSLAASGPPPLSLPPRAGDAEEGGGRRAAGWKRCTPVCSSSSPAQSKHGCRASSPSTHSTKQLLFHGDKFATQHLAVCSCHMKVYETLWVASDRG